MPITSIFDGLQGFPDTVVSNERCFLCKAGKRLCPSTRRLSGSLNPNLKYDLNGAMFLGNLSVASLSSGLMVSFRSWVCVSFLQVLSFVTKVQKHSCLVRLETEFCPIKVWEWMVIWPLGTLATLLRYKVILYMSRSVCMLIILPICLLILNK